MTKPSRLTTNSPLLKEPGTDVSMERVRIIRATLQEGGSYKDALTAVRKAEGTELRSDTFRMFLQAYFGTSRWPHAVNRAQTTNSQQRLRKLKRWSKEGIDKREAMNRLGIGEVAFNRFIHRHYGSCIWPLGEGVDGKVAPPSLPQMPTELIVPTVVSDRMALDYINHRTEHDGEKLEKVLEELPWVRHTWSLMCGFVRMRAPNE